MLDDMRLERTLKKEMFANIRALPLARRSFFAVCRHMLR
ncbi:hypothetical protein BRO54_1446 [Geobacillus proteiniphilus]|uniref:Uncharacterized protein n=1 Tax=Geobacillus proteiniphilus TaxID=860353 RepID=A0A1Q5T3C1_9BACL|nr:hypothetical protein BRO54_1446 [Geobacillus proteiniphilus]